MASSNKDNSQKDILDDKINIRAVNAEQNDVCPYVSELTNATKMDLTQTSTKIPQMTLNIPRPITKMTDCIDKTVQVGSNYFISNLFAVEKQQFEMGSIAPFFCTGICSEPINV